MFNGIFPNRWSTLKRLMWLKTVALNAWKTVTGAVVSFLCGSSSPMKSLTVTMLPQQSGSGDPSPDNVRPITGHSEVNVWRTGKNLFDPSNVLDNTYINASTEKLTYASGSKTVYAKIEPGKTYTVSKIQSARFTVAFTDTFPEVPTSGNPTNTTTNRQQDNTATSITRTAPTGSAYIVAVVCHSSDADAAAILASVQIEESEAATAYEPFTGSTISVTISTPPGTVYGGTLDVVSGVLTVDKAGVDMGTSDQITYSYNATLAASGTFPFTVNGRKNTEAVMCSAYKVNSPGSWNVENGEIAWVSGNNNLRIRNTECSTVAQLQTALTGVQLIYTLATPLAYQLTPQEASTLVGQNNVWSDVGDVAVTYKP